MRSWAMLVESTRSSSSDVRVSALAKNGTIAAKTMLAMTIVTSSSTMLKPRARTRTGTVTKCRPGTAVWRAHALTSAARL